MRSLLAPGCGALPARGGRPQHGRASVGSFPACPVRTTGLIPYRRYLPNQREAQPSQPQLLRAQPASATAASFPQSPATPPAPAVATSSLDNVFFTGFKTEGIRQCMRLAEEEARATPLALIQPAHVLLACLRLPELQQQALQGVQLSVDDVRAVLRVGMAEQQHLDEDWEPQAASSWPAALLPHPMSEATRALLHRAFLLALSRGCADLCPSDLLHCLTAGQQNTVDITHAPLAYAYMRLVPEAASLKDTLVRMLVDDVEDNVFNVLPEPKYLYGTYKWTIDNFKELAKGKSRTVEIYATGCKWQLEACCKHRRCNPNPTGFYRTQAYPIALETKLSQVGDESVKATHLVTICNHKDSTRVGMIASLSHTLDTFHPTLGEVATCDYDMSTLMDPDKGWLKDGALTVEVHLKVDKASLSSTPPVTPTPAAAPPPHLVKAAANMTSVADVAQVLSAYLDLGLTPDQATCQAAAAILRSPTAAQQVKEWLTHDEVVQLLQGMMALPNTSVVAGCVRGWFQAMISECLTKVWAPEQQDKLLWGGGDGIAWHEASAVMQALAQWKPLLPDELTAQLKKEPSATSSIYTWYASDLQQGDVMWQELLDAVSSGEPWQEVVSCFKSLQVLGARDMQQRGLKLVKAVLESPVMSTADKAAAVHQLATLCEVSAQQRDWVQLMAGHNIVQFSTPAYLIKLLTPAGRQPISCAAAVMPADECMRVLNTAATAMCINQDVVSPQLQLQLTQTLPQAVITALPEAALQLLNDSRKLQLISPQAYRALTSCVRPALAQPDLRLEQLPWKDDLKQVLQSCIGVPAPVSSPVIRAEDQSEVFSLQDVHSYLTDIQCSEQLKEMHTAALPDSIQAILDAVASAQSAASKAGLWCRVLQQLPGLEAPTIAAVLLKCEAAGLVSKQEAVTSLCVLVDPGTALVQDSLQPCLAALIHLTKEDPGISQLPVFKTWLDRARLATVNKLWGEHVMPRDADVKPSLHLPLLQLLPIIRHLDASAIIALGTTAQTTMLVLECDEGDEAAHALWCLSTAWTSDPCPQWPRHDTSRGALLAHIQRSLTRGSRALLQLAAAACQFKHVAETQASPDVTRFLADACQEVVWSVDAALINDLTNEELMMMGAMAVLLKPAGPLAADHPSITHLQLLISQLEARQADGRLVISTEVEPAVEPAAGGGGGRGSAAAASARSHKTSSATLGARWSSVLQAMKVQL